MRRSTTAMVLAAVVMVAWGSTVAADAPRKPNILLILADDLGYGELSCQGNPQIPTPNIDSIARNGVRFTSGYVSCPICSPSRAGLMTGRYQQRFGHELNFPKPDRLPNPCGMPLSEKTLAERLKAAGYVTGMFGKWHLGFRPEFHPMKRGFDEYFGFLGGLHQYLSAADNGHGPILRGTKPVASIDYTTDAFGREAAAFIEKHRDRPWFVYLPFNAVHGPLQATEKYLSRFENIAEKKRRTYAAMESAMDDAVGAVLTKVRELGLEENTLVFFLSDNGGPTWLTTSRNDPLNGVKGQLREGGMREPFLMQWKGHIPAGKVDDRPIIQLDVAPTALAAAGIAVTEADRIDGVNLLPYLMGENKATPHEALFWRYGPQRAVRMGDWKLLEMGKGVRLYNLAKDIGEMEDLAAKEPGKVKELEAAYAKWDAQNIAPGWSDDGKAAERMEGAIPAE